MSENWSEIRVQDACDTLRSKRRKLLARDYGIRGRFPIVDQGQEAIAGWSDDESLVVSDELPLIVFGDHSRTFKYIDQPFIVGADGTQLLKPNKSIDPLFFYFACRNLDIPSRGYNRHFTILKEKTIRYPDLPLQRKIAAILRKIQQAIEVETNLIRVTRELKAAVMKKLFTEGLNGETQKETDIGMVPESWPIVPFDEALQIAQGQVDPRLEPYASMPHIGPENIEAQTGFLLQCQTAKDLGLISGKYLFNSGDIIYSKIRPYLNKVAMPTFDGVCSADMYPLKAKPGFHKAFLFHFLLSDLFLHQAVPHQLRTGIPKINREQLAATSCPKPPPDVQLEVACVLDALDREIAVHKNKSSVLSELFRTVLSKLMSGAIRLDDRGMNTFDLESEGVAA